MWSSNDFLSTKPFTFLLGADAKPIVVQGGLFKDISKPLHARIPQSEDEKSGTWQLGSDSIADVEWNVFAGLVEYAYTGDYARSIPLALRDTSCTEDHSVPEEDNTQLPIADDDHNSDLGFEESDEQYHDGWGSFSKGKKKDKKKGKALYSYEPKKISLSQTSESGPALSELLWQQFIKRKPSIGDSQVSKGSVPPSQNTAALLYHAKLCVLANRYMVDNLQHLCLTKLHYVLIHFAIKPEQIDGFLDLVEYVYMEEGVQGVPELREIVLLFTAAKLNILRQDPRLRCMLEAFGNLGADIVYEISKAQNWR